MSAAGSEADGSLTVAGVLDFDALRTGNPEVVSGGQSLDRPIRWVHIADSEQVERFLEGGELVLTTAQTFRRSAAAMIEFFDQLELAGAAGAVVELVDESARPDPVAAQVVREAAADRELPVIVLSRTVKFVRITELAHRALLARQLGRLERAQEIHETYTQLSLERADVETIVARTASLLEAPVVLEDVGRRVLAHAGPGSAELVEEWTRLRAGDGRSGWVEIAVGLRDRRWGRLVVPVPRADPGPDRPPGGPCGGALAAVSPGLSSPEAASPTAVSPTAVSSAVEQIVERASQALTLTRMAESDERDLLRQAQSGFVREVMDSGVVDEEQARARARSLGFDPSSGVRFVPTVVRIDRDSATDPTRIQLWERALVREATEAARSQRIPVLSANLQSGAFGLVLALPARTDESKALERLFAAMADIEQTWTIGVGRSSTALITAITRIDSAAQVAEVAATLELRERTYYRFSDVRLRGLLSGLRDDPRLRAFAEAELGPLLDEDDEAGLRFLDLCLTHGGNKSAIARAAYLSRPSLYAKIAKLENRLGVSLDDAESRAALHVALLWWRMNR